MGGRVLKQEEFNKYSGALFGYAGGVSSGVAFGASLKLTDNEDLLGGDTLTAVSSIAIGILVMLVIYNAMRLYAERETEAVTQQKSRWVSFKGSMFPFMAFATVCVGPKIDPSQKSEYQSLDQLITAKSSEEKSTSTDKPNYYYEMPTSPEKRETVDYSYVGRSPQL